MFSAEINRLENEKRSMITLYREILESLRVTNKKLYIILHDKVFEKLILLDYYLQHSKTDTVNVMKNQLNNILQNITNCDEKYIANNFINIVKEVLQIHNKIKRLKKQYIGG